MEIQYKDFLREEGKTLSWVTLDVFDFFQENEHLEMLDYEHIKNGMRVLYQLKVDSDMQAK